MRKMFLRAVSLICCTALCLSLLFTGVTVNAEAPEYDKYLDGMYASIYLRFDKQSLEAGESVEMEVVMMPETDIIFNGIDLQIQPEFEMYSLNAFYYAEGSAEINEAFSSGVEISKNNAMFVFQWETVSKEDFIELSAGEEFVLATVTLNTWQEAAQYEGNYNFYLSVKDFYFFYPDMENSYIYDINVVTEPINPIATLYLGVPFEFLEEELSIPLVGEQVRPSSFFTNKSLEEDDILIQNEDIIELVEIVNHDEDFSEIKVIGKELGQTRITFYSGYKDYLETVVVFTVREPQIAMPFPISSPNKLDYHIGDSITVSDLEGISLKAEYDNGDVRTFSDISEFSLENGSVTFSEAGKIPVDVYYNDEQNLTRVTFNVSDHSYAPVSKIPATTESDGSVTEICGVCDDDRELPIYKIKSVAFKKATTTYDGTTKKPSVVVKDSQNEVLELNTDYTIEYPEEMKDPGSYKVTVKFIGNYSGQQDLDYEIEPIDLSAPKTVSASLYGYDDVKVSWSAVSNADAYKVYYRNSSKSSYTYLGTTTKTYYTKSNLSDGAKYYFKVVPCFEISSGYYEDSSYKTCYITTARNLSAPKSVSAYLYGYDDVKVSWSKVSYADAYKVYYRNASKSSYSYLGTTTNTYYTKSNLSDGAKYYFKVVPCIKVNGSYYVDSSYKTDYIYTLKKVSTPSVSRYSSSKVKVSWSNISGESGYQISKSTSKTKTGTIYTYSTTSGKSKTISATRGKTYYYKVRAYRTVNGKRIYAPWSSVKSYKLK